MDIKEILHVLKDLGFDEIIIDNSITQNKIKLLEEINKEIQVCTKCDLHKERKQAVLGEGNPNSPIMFIGEAPGEEEDKQGRPFVGRAGQLLTKAIELAGYKRSDVYIANINKCRPPGNRTPTVEEQEACFPYLKRQIDIINPKVLCLLGATAYRGIFKREAKITKERGNILDYEGKKVYVTYHPAYVLRNPKEEEIFFEDIKNALDLAFGR
ncbi:MAG: uracil-DNA glycosylase [Sulfurihydrogenibium sp.]|uniref:uracil-DNA glycosylase n=1 Tax=Sulfurihydrogenibium sp. TaxID=2053621 RepID=UPI003D0F801D